MKIVNVRKFGNRLLLELDCDLPSNFRNHIDVSIGGVVFKDAVLVMSQGNNRRTDFSVIDNGFIDIVGKELLL